eukprot:3553518-Pyramimonas_sp.AAC.1
MKAGRSQHVTLTLAPRAFVCRRCGKSSTDGERFPLKNVAPAVTPRTFVLRAYSTFRCSYG